MTLDVDIFDPGTVAYTSTVYQYTKDVVLMIRGIELPAEYEAHFSMSNDRGLSVACKGDASGVKIPDELFMPGDYVYVWICSANADKARNETLCMVTIPVSPRPVPIPIQYSEEKFRYRIDEDEEDLEFEGKMNQIIQHDMEEE